MKGSNTSEVELSDCSYGFAISIGRGVLSTDEECTCAVQIVIPDSLKIPLDYVLVSAVYSVKFSCDLVESVTFKIQHCSDNNVLEHLTFLHAHEDGM